MMIDSSRLLSNLKRDGFELGWVDKVVKEAVFVRSSSISPAFERVRAYAAGRQGDALLASVGVSVVKGRNATKGLLDTQLLLELAGDPLRGWTIVASEQDVRLWEKRLTEIASARATAYARVRGPQIVTETAAAREDAKRYFDELLRISKDRGVAQWIVTISPAIREEALRIAQWPGVLQIPGGDDIYQIATHCIIVSCERVEGRRYNGCDPHENRELMWRIQLLVDLMNQSGQHW